MSNVLDLDTPSAVLADDGPLAELLDDFSARRQQQEMADVIGRILAESGVLIGEAGTGTGKTLAYLVPALLSGKKVIVSTGTRNLQDQLFHRDLPIVRRALGSAARVRLLKGRSNYLCLERLRNVRTDRRSLDDTQHEDVQTIREWAGRTRTGDIAEIGQIPEQSPLWPQVTSTADNCLGQDCDDFEDCFVFRARRRAQEADVLVINHYLFFADMALRSEGFGEVLPTADALIFDEAHQLPELAVRYLGKTLSSRQLLELVHDTVAAQLSEGGDSPDVARAAAVVERCTRDLRLAFGEAGQRATWKQIAKRPAIDTALLALQEALVELGTLLEAIAERGKELENCMRRCADLGERLTQMTGTVPDGFVQWLEVFKRGFSLQLTPIDVADTFRDYMAGYPAAWIFTSATLAVGDSFSHFSRELGLEGAETHCWSSPFDYPRQALMYLPEDLPDPRSAGFSAFLLDAVIPVLQASQGRAFLLFTSHRALQHAAGELRDRLPYPLLVQGSEPRSVLLERFRHTANAVLLGTGSFWEGVDVRGDALSLVVIDKLPFASPDDPVLKARLDALAEQGLQPFMQYQVPQAVMALKQGAGRLIRDVNDRGVLMLGDARLASKGYGKTFIRSLPPMRRSRKLADVEAFFAGMD